MFYINKLLTNSIPDSFSQSDLEELMKKAPKENENTSKGDVNPDSPFNGHDRKQLVRSIRKAIDELDDKFECHPMVMKIMILECLSDLVELHTNFGLAQFEDGEKKSAVSWLRDAGKLQAAMSALLEVELPDDFTIPQ